MQNCQPSGDHYLINFFGCDKKQLESVEFWKNIFSDSIKKSKMTVLKDFFYEFEPCGVTAFFLLSSSHLSIHTWPEYEYAACDLFSCSGEDDAKNVIDHIVNQVVCSKSEIKHIKRGYIHE